MRNRSRMVRLHTVCYVPYSPSNDVTGGLRTKYVVLNIAVGVVSAFKRFIEPIAEQGSIVNYCEDRTTNEEGKSHMGAPSSTPLPSHIVLTVDKKLRTEIRSAGTNGLWRICICMSLAVFTMFLAS